MDRDDAARGMATSVRSRIVRYIFVFGLTLLGLFVARDFLLPLAWALILTIAGWPLYHRFRERIPRRGRAALAPLLFTLLVALVLLLPLTLVAVSAGREAGAAVNWAVRFHEHGMPAPDWLAKLPFFGGQAATWWQTHLANPESAAGLLGQVDAGKLAAWAGALGTALASGSLAFLLTLLALFFTLRNGDWLGERTLSLAARLQGEEGAWFLERLASAIRGTVTGTVLVALGEGGAIGIGYAVAGVPQAVLFTVLTIALAMLPLGAWIAVALAALLLLAQGSAAAAAALFLFGAAVMLVGDHLVQPALIGSAARLPFLWAMVGTFGGVASFGLIGLFIGPVIMAAVLLVWREWIDAR